MVVELPVAVLVASNSRLPARTTVELLSAKALVLPSIVLLDARDEPLTTPPPPPLAEALVLGLEVAWNDERFRSR